MTTTHLCLTLLTVLSLSVGQLLFKLAAQWLAAHEGLVARLVLNPYLITALLLYGGATLLWVYLLSKHRLSLLYPFTALAFFMVPLLAHWLMGEPLRWQTLAGALLILAGVAVSTLEAG